MKWDKDELSKAIQESTSMSDLLRKLGLQIYNGNYRTAKKYIEIYKLDISHFTRNTISGNKNRKRELNDILTEKSFISGGKLKVRLIHEGLLKNECSICGQLPEWNNKPLTLILDHINGEHTDNRIENLRIVCRHCDSQLPTFAGRNIKNRIKKNCLSCGKELCHKRKTGLCWDCYKIQSNKKHNIDNYNPKTRKYLKSCSCGKKISLHAKSCKSCSGTSHRKVIDRPSKDDLLNMIKTLPFLQIGEIFGVSDNAVRKWAKQYGLPFKKKDIKNLN